MEASEVVSWGLCVCQKFQGVGHTDREATTRGQPTPSVSVEEWATSLIRFSVKLLSSKKKKKKGRGWEIKG